MKNIATYNLYEYLEKNNDVDKIYREIYLHKTSKVSREEYLHPIKANCTICCICLQGELTGKIDLKEYHVTSSSISISLPGQILEFDRQSDDFCGIFIYLTQQFTEKLNLLLDHTIAMKVKNRPHIVLNNEELQSILNYYDTVKKVIKTEDNPNRLQIITHLTIAYFYGVGYFIHKSAPENTKSKNQIITDRFLKEVRLNFKTERKVDFYARKMQLSANYLSHVVKEVTKKTAGEWIDDYVVLEARALLKSTNMTVQQIADELNFPTQTYFGRYFKRMTGIAPKFYR